MSSILTYHLYYVQRIKEHIKRIFQDLNAKKTKNIEGCPRLVDYVMIWIKEPSIKNGKSTKDVFISWVNKI